MDKNFNVPPPINLNCWKHHAGFITHQIKTVKRIETPDEVKIYLLKIGESQMDLYFSNYSPAEISEQILEVIERKKIFTFEKYKDWLSKDGKDYQLLKLKDKSVWTLRLGEDPNRYVHIHPARYSPHSMRVKATTLKTAIIILCLEQIRETKIVDTKSVNYIRSKYLSESPIKSFSNASGLGRILNLLRRKVRI